MTITLGKVRNMQKQNNAACPKYSLYRISKNTCIQFLRIQIHVSYVQLMKLKKQYPKKLQKICVICICSVADPDQTFENVRFRIQQKRLGSETLCICFPVKVRLSSVFILILSSVVVPDPGSSAFLLEGSGMIFFPDPGPRIPDPKHD
jgi:hypothetical protein